MDNRVLNRSLLTVSVLLGLASIGTVCMLVYHWRDEAYRRRHRLVHPLVVSTEQGVGVLPTGTALVHEEPGNGFSRYCVSVNVFGPGLDLTTDQLPFLNEPVLSWSERPLAPGGPLVTDDRLVELLTGLGVSASDLDRVRSRLE